MPVKGPGIAVRHPDHVQVPSTVGIGADLLEKLMRTAFPSTAPSCGRAVASKLAKQLVTAQFPVGSARSTNTTCRPFHVHSGQCDPVCDCLASCAASTETPFELKNEFEFELGFAV